jgi:hypothetical protein
MKEMQVGGRRANSHQLREEDDERAMNESL